MRNARRRGADNSLIMKILIGVLLVVVVVLIAVVFLRGEKEPSSDRDWGKENSETESEGSKYDMETFVLFGVDSRENQLGKGTSSDSIMLINLNHDLEEVRIVSIYRDTMVDMDPYIPQKLTYAHALEGSEFALKTINRNFDLNIKKYATFNFNSTGDIIDALGGVEMDITADEVKYINGYIDEVNDARGTSSAHITEPGKYTLDGTQAVAYSRIRYTDGGDFKRTERQRDVLFKMFKKVKAMGTEDRVEFAEDFMDRIKTNYSTDRMTSLLYCMSQYEIVEMDAFPKVFYGGLVEENWVEVPATLIDMNRELHQVLLLEEEYEPSETVKEISAMLEGKADGPNFDLHKEE